MRRPQELLLRANRVYRPGKQRWFCYLRNLFTNGKQLPILDKFCHRRTGWALRLISPDYGLNSPRICKITARTRSQGVAPSGRIRLMTSAAFRICLLFMRGMASKASMQRTSFASIPMCFSNKSAALPDERRWLLSFLSTGIATSHCR
jgi:hypothetical protein